MPDPRQIRFQVLALYKTLLYYGRDYPMGYNYFRDRCHRSFTKHKSETDLQEIAKLISRGEFIIKELEALYRLKKYRYLKQRYYPEKTEQLTPLAQDTRNFLKKIKETELKR